jgi:hypothetical protein
MDRQILSAILSGVGGGMTAGARAYSGEQDRISEMGRQKLAQLLQQAQFQRQGAMDKSTMDYRNWQMTKPPAQKAEKPLTEAQIKGNLLNEALQDPEFKKTYILRNLLKPEKKDKPEKVPDPVKGALNIKTLRDWTIGQERQRETQNWLSAQPPDKVEEWAGQTGFNPENKMMFSGQNMPGANFRKNADFWRYGNKAAIDSSDVLNGLTPQPSQPQGATDLDALEKQLQELLAREMNVR